MQKQKQQLEALRTEIGKTLLGESLYSPEDLKDAINVIKAKIADGEKQMEELEIEINQKKDMEDTILPEYRRFENWAEEFDTAIIEQKKMIACQLFERIELGKNYNITLHMNGTYQMFCTEWKEKSRSQLTA